MKIFEFDSPEAMKDGAVAKQVDGEGSPIKTCLLYTSPSPRD